MSRVSILVNLLHSRLQASRFSFRKFIIIKVWSLIISDYDQSKIFTIKKGKMINIKKIISGKMYIKYNYNNFNH